MSKIKDSNDFTIVIDAEYKKIPFDCPVCKSALRDASDIVSYKKFGCCRDCEDLHYWPNLEKWKEGWRPILKKTKAKS